MEISHSIHRGSILKKNEAGAERCPGSQNCSGIDRAVCFQVCEKEFHSEYRNLVIKLRGKSEIRINY